MRPRGFTLIEIIVTIIVVAVAASALLGAFGNLVRGSADPVVQQQATTIAEAYMEEILLHAFDDPQVAETGGAEAGETRPTFDDVQDYNGLGTSQVRDQNDNPIAALAAYSVSVTVNSDTLNTVPAGAAMRIDVTVSHPAVDDISLTGYRTRYP